MKKSLFVYGTLKDSKIQKELLGRIIKGVPDKLINYKKFEIIIDGEKYPIIKYSRGNNIDGVVLIISPDELKILDEYEGKEYKRIKIILKSGKETYVYVKNNFANSDK